MQTLEQDSSTLVTLIPLGAEHRTQSGSWIHVMLDLEASHQVFNAKAEDWHLWQAGQRVQVIKRDEAAGGVLKLGTEIVTSEDGTIAGLLGASPGASTAVPIMVSLLQKVFKDKVATPAWQEKLHQILPSYGTQLNDDPAKVVAVR